MIVYFGADHRGFELKKILKDYVKSLGYEVADLGDDNYDENDDYPDFASLVAEKVGAASDTSRGIVICGSGAGVDIVVNKFKNIRSTLALSSDQVFDARRDDDINILSLAADFTEPENAKNYTKVFLETSFSNEPRVKRRIEKIWGIENGW